ncbi:YbaK/EbsC family protein [Endozoicomonas ascidiicola]|uniref:YbaK/EbsC family protein n=1 Tax=Endozoicomonas ascidiicola TaxID=1698521 RepID=UPI00082E21BC|nr:YbaK/EbsC family protein [Endozoicomonas ascidiicola]
MIDLHGFISEYGADWIKVFHPPVTSCDEFNNLFPELPGSRAKNLFLCDRKARQFYLLVMEDHKYLDWKHISKLAGRRLQMASADNLKEQLNLDRGALSIFALVNDPERKVKLMMDKDVWTADSIQCHPCNNRTTIIAPMETIRYFLSLTGHEPTIVTVSA